MELLKDYDCEVKYHLGKAKVVTCALSRKVQGSTCKLLSMVVETKVGVSKFARNRELIPKEAHRLRY